jgi:predicted phage-related endonuclease
MMCSGAAWSTCAVLVMNRALDLHLYAVPRHAEAEAKIAAAVAKFWEAVERGEQPPPILPQDRKTLAAMFRTDNGETLDLSGDNALPELLEERRGLKAAHKTAELRIAEIEDEVRMKVGAAAIATLPGWRITWRSVERKEFTVPAKTVRTLRIAQRNGDNHDDR